MRYRVFIAILAFRLPLTYMLLPVYALETWNHTAKKVLKSCRASQAGGTAALSENEGGAKKNATAMLPRQGGPV